MVVEEIENQDFLVEELEDQDIAHLVFNSYIEEQIGEGGKKLTECIISMVESVHGQYVKERANAIVKEANDSPLTTRVMQVLKQAVEDDRHHKCCVLCKEVAMNGFHLLHRCEKSYETIVGRRRCNTHIMYKLVHSHSLQPKKGKASLKPMVKTKKVDSPMKNKGLYCQNMHD